MIPKELRTCNGYIIYVHKSPSGKVYIGKTKQKPINRWGYNGINYFYKRNTKFASAIAKYGWDNFEHYIIASNLTLEQANRLETSLIHYHRNVLGNCYNLADGGEGNGHPVSEKTKERLREVNKGKILSEDTKSKISSANGKHVIAYLEDGSKLEFQSIRKLSEYLGVCQAKLSKLLRANDRIVFNGVTIEVNNDNTRVL